VCTVELDKPSSVISDSQPGTPGVVICFNCLLPNSGSTRARSNDSVFVAVVSPTVDHLYAIVRTREPPLLGVFPG
jgi:hypothetical protein